MNTFRTRLLPVIWLLLACAIAPLPAQAQSQPFIVSDIRVEGLQRISAGSVFAAMPLAVGDLVDASLIRADAWKGNAGTPREWQSGQPSPARRWLLPAGST